VSLSLLSMFFNPVGQSLAIKCPPFLFHGGEDSSFPPLRREEHPFFFTSICIARPWPVQSSWFCKERLLAFLVVRVARFEVTSFIVLELALVFIDCNFFLSDPYSQKGFTSYCHSIFPHFDSTCRRLVLLDYYRSAVSLVEVPPIPIFSLNPTILDYIASFPAPFALNVFFTSNDGLLFFSPINFFS